MPRTDDDQGFTLIELLVVVVVLGILAAIAIPALAAQRHKAVDASIRSDLHTVALELESYSAENHAYPGSVPASSGTTTGANTITVTPGHPARLSSGNIVTYELSTSGEAYCLFATNASGTQGAGAGYRYVSSAGGLDTTAVTGCPASY